MTRVVRRLTRRQQLRWIASLTTASLLEAQDIQNEPPGRITPLAEFVNLLEFEAMARRKLDPAVFALIAGGDRSAFENMTFRPRVMVDTSKLDLTTDLFGQSMFAPILIGPASQLQRFHPDGELALVRGASAAKAAVVVSSNSSVPLDRIAAEAKTPLWVQVFAGPDPQAARQKAKAAVSSGCKAVVITVGMPPETLQAAAKSQPIRWNLVDAVREGMDAPMILKGIMTAEEADTAIRHGAQGIIVSNYGRRSSRLDPAPIQVLPLIADATKGRVPILFDGGLRRGTDILKALILGAQAVLISRPALWGLATYGADGVQTVMEMAQTELARNMAMLGTPNAKAFHRGLLRIHTQPADEAIRTNQTRGN